MRTLAAICAVLLAAGLVLSGAAPAAEAAPASLLRDFRHTVWTVADGAPAQIDAMAQTPDGWLWLGTSDGLYRFDGVAFERRELPARGLLARPLIINMHATDKGELWLAYIGGGLSVLHPDGRLDDLPAPPGAPLGPVGAMASDTDGSMWVIGSAGLYHYAGGAWRAVATGREWNTSMVRSLLLDQYGRLWVASDSQVYMLDRASGVLRPVAHAALPAHWSGSLLQSPDGRVWVTGEGRAMQIFPVTGLPDRPARARGNEAESRWRGQFDRAGNLWSLRCPTGVCLASAASASLPATLDAAGAGERLAAPAQISGLDADQLLEDREGNIWIATENGLDRYQPNRVRRAGVAGPGSALSLAVDDSGVAWMANAASASLWRLDGAGAPVLQQDHKVRVVASARDGALLLVGRREIERRSGGKVEHIALPPGADGKPADLDVLGVNDDGKVLWMAALQTGLMGRVDGKWLPRSAFKLPAKTIIATPGEAGQLWVADGDGVLSSYGSGPALRFDATAVGFASGVFYRAAVPGAPMTVVISGAQGTGVLRNGVFRMLRAADGDVLRKITGMAVTKQGERWFNGWRGLVRVSAADWQRALDHPDEMLRLELVGALDGYPGQATSVNRLPSMVIDRSGQLWASASGGALCLDSAAPPRNLVAPRVEIDKVSTAQGSFAAAPLQAQLPLQLPPGQQNFDISFTAPALRRPEGLHYTYWLEGFDRQWRDGGNRRMASYTGVAPGDYRFHVRVSNEDGVTSSAVATRLITVTPTILQTWWFQLLCALMLVLLIAALYRYRVGVLTARLSERLRVRAAERERIARTLHDTYLQSVHVLLLRVGAVTESLPAGHGLRTRMRALLEDATSAVVEGRGQVEQLRAGGGASIEDIIARTAAPLMRCYPAVSLQVSSRGALRPLTAALLEEAGEIAAEAVRNAYLHANAQRIDVELDYAAALTIRVSDDGAGFDAATLEQGYRSGHWGLIGMRERARQIGAVLSIANSPGGGAQVSLQVPGRLAYAKKPRRWLR